MEPLNTAAPTTTRLVTYNLGQGGPRRAAEWVDILAALAPDLLFVQESRDPAQSWLDALPGADRAAWCWAPAPHGRWGCGLGVRAGQLEPLPVPPAWTGQICAALVAGRTWPGGDRAPVLAVSLHGPPGPGGGYVAEIGRILDWVGAVATGRMLILAGDFNVVVGLRPPGARPNVTAGERALLARLAGEFGLVPCWQTAHPGEPLARTLRWRRRTDSLPYHCDGLFVPQTWAAALTNCTVLEGPEWLPRSDHNPVVAILST
jgi:endonuclease/exonuclease/phosphatase family metal-dependent hydrolase